MTMAGAQHLVHSMYCVLTPSLVMYIIALQARKNNVLEFLELLLDPPDPHNSHMYMYRYTDAPVYNLQGFTAIKISVIF